IVPEAGSPPTKARRYAPRVTSALVPSPATSHTLNASVASTPLNAYGAVTSGRPKSVRPAGGTLPDPTTPLSEPAPSVRHPEWTMGSVATPSPAFGSGDVVAAPAGIVPATT